MAKSVFTIMPTHVATIIERVFSLKQFTPKLVLSLSYQLDLSGSIETLLAHRNRVNLIKHCCVVEKYLKNNSVLIFCEANFYLFIDEDRKSTRLNSSHV